MPLEQLRGGWWRAGARVQQRNAHFAPRECGVEHGEISHDDGKQAQARAGFQNDDGAHPAIVRRYVTKPKRQESGSAEVQVRSNAQVLRAVIEGAAQPVIEQRKPHGHCGRPHGQQKDQRHGAVKAEGRLPLTHIADSPGEENPRLPGSDKEKAREPEAAGGAARQNNRLEGVEQRREQADNAGNESDNPHRSPRARGASFAPALPTILA